MSKLILRIGIAELIAGVLLLVPSMVWIGAGLTLGIIGATVLMHLTSNGELWFMEVEAFCL